jgi:hypothetical protein
VLHSLLIEDTIASTPSFLQATLAGLNSETLFSTTTAVRIRLTSLIKHGLEAGADLWRSLQVGCHPQPARYVLLLTTYELLLATRYAFLATRNLLLATCY